MVMSNKDISSRFVGKYGYFISTYRTGQTFLIPNNKAFASLDYKAIAANTTEFSRIINFHSFFSVGRDGSVSSRELEADGRYKTNSNNEFLTVLQARVSPTGWQFTPAGAPDKGAKNVIANVVKADIKAVEGLMHEIDQVLIPPHPQPRGGECDYKAHSEASMCPIMDMVMEKGMDMEKAPASSEGRERRQGWPPRPGGGGTCEAGYQMIYCGWGGGQCVESSCKASSLATWDGRGNCCEESNMCVYRKNGNGDRCEARQPIPATSTTPMPLPKCPEECKATWDHCVAKYSSQGGKKQGEEACEKTASNGFLCVDNGASVKCSGSAWFKTDCPDVQVFTDCNGNERCWPTCDNPHPICPRMCMEGCVCPNNMLWDYVEEKCLAADASECPDIGQCEPQVAGNFESAGGQAADCHQAVGVGDTCAPPGCLEGCVPTAGTPDFQRQTVYCSSKGKTQADCKQYGGKYCEWAAPSAESTPPTYECSDEGSWVLSSEGTCASGAGVEVSMCDFFEQTGCLEADCDSTAESYSECTALIGESLSTCQLTCMFTHGKPEAESKCAACLDDAMMSSFDISEDQSDLVSCCNCITTTLGKKGMSQAQMNDMFESVCPTDPVFEDDDDAR